LSKCQWRRLQRQHGRRGLEGRLQAAYERVKALECMVPSSEAATGSTCCFSDATDLANICSSLTEGLAYLMQRGNHDFKPSENGTAYDQVQGGANTAFNQVSHANTAFDSAQGGANTTDYDTALDQVLGDAMANTTFDQVHGDVLLGGASTASDIVRHVASFQEDSMSETHVFGPSQNPPSSCAGPVGVE